MSKLSFQNKVKIAWCLKKGIPIYRKGKKIAKGLNKYIAEDPEETEEKKQDREAELYRNLAETYPITENDKRLVGTYGVVSPWLLPFIGPGKVVKGGSWLWSKVGTPVKEFLHLLLPGRWAARGAQAARKASSLVRGKEYIPGLNSFEKGLESGVNNGIFIAETIPATYNITLGNGSGWDYFNLGLGLLSGASVGRSLYLGKKLMPRVALATGLGYTGVKIAAPEIELNPIPAAVNFGTKLWLDYHFRNLESNSQSGSLLQSANEDSSSSTNNANK